MNIRQVDLMFEAVRDDRVTERRIVAGDSAPDFYGYRWYVDGEPATTPQQAALRNLLQRGAIHSEGYFGIVGPAGVRMDIG